MGSTRATAIIGMAIRFPGASTVERFWENLRAGRESLTFYSESELMTTGVRDELLRHPNYVKAEGGKLQGIDLFDASFFGMTPRDAAATDPQQRLFLECAWEALEDAGYCSDAPPRTGLFACAGMNQYLFNIRSSLDALESPSDFQLVLQNDKDFLPTRTAYKLNLRGPCVAVQSACSSSLVAVHLACNSLFLGECELALAGGAAIRVTDRPDARSGYLYAEGSIASHDGHCRAFDAAASGTVGGNGVAVVLLKPLDTALRDRDSIRAVILGSAVNNDGATKIGYTAPSVEGQKAVVTGAWRAAGIDPSTISYIEAHGTGTLMGDSIEIEALTQAFAEFTDRQHFCAIGSVKSNIGHLDTTAGVAGLIKTVLALKHRLIPATLNVTVPVCKGRDGALFVNTIASGWPRGRYPRRAGVSSFGIGGTNAHIVLEEAPDVVRAELFCQSHAVLVSARSRSALHQACENLSRHIARYPDIDLGDVAFTTQVGRRQFVERRAVIAETTEEVVRSLAGVSAVISGRCPESEPAIVFLFPGQGSQFTGMGRELYNSEPIFRQNLDRCADIFARLLERDLRDEILRSEDSSLEASHLAQPAIFAVSVACAALWQSLGVRPRAMLGHSLGEFVAACLAGVFTLEDAARIVAVRSRLVERTPLGAMLAVAIEPDEILRLISGTRLDLAAVNAPSQCVVSGAEAVVESFGAELASRGIAARRLAASRAFHSALVEPVVTELKAVLTSTPLNPPSLPFISNFTGTWITPAQCLDREYWARHLCFTVRFSDGLKALVDVGDRVLVEVGPDRVLTSLALQSTARRGLLAAVPTFTPKNGERREFLTAAARLWINGVNIDWSATHTASPPGRVPLPTYPFERQSYWFYPGSKGSNGQTLESVLPAVPRKPDEAAQQIADCWRDVLGIESVQEDDNFFDLGGHSLLLPEVLARLREAFGDRISLQMLVEAPTPASLAECLRTSGNDRVSQGSRIDLRKEAELDPAIFPPRDIQPGGDGSILLTGATGFLGSHLLRELLERMEATIYCLARHPSALLVQSRVVPVHGDLGKPLLGLTKAAFNDLAAKVDSIYHCGAWVNHVYPYSILKRVNALGTAEILRLACLAKPKTLHYVSTLAVFSPLFYSEDRVAIEDDLLESARGLASGYAESKWVAEKYVHAASRRGLPVVVYRPGVLGGHTQTGECNTSNFVWRLIKGCIQLGCAPVLALAVAISPVDYVSRAIVYVSLQPDRAGRIFHLSNPQPLSWMDLVSWVKENVAPLELLPYRDWRSRLLRGLPADNALAPFLPLFERDGDKIQEPDSHGMTRYDCRNTEAALAGSSIACQPVDSNLLERCFSYFSRSGFLRPAELTRE